MKKNEKKITYKKARGNAWNDSDAKCPFFHEHTAISISCEAPIPGASMRMTFYTKADKKVQYDLFCCCRYKNCEIFRMVMGKYAED
jgi:hypothetical protein